MENFKKELIIKIVNESKSKSAVCKKLGLHNNGKNMKIINELINKHNIEITHFIRNDKKKRVTKKCPVCYKDFETIKGSKKEKTVCSISCSNTFFRSGVNHPNYKDISEMNERSSSFCIKYRKICFDNHDHKCVVCIENKLLDVHHYDGNKFNNEPNNLIPLCATHHNYMHSQYKDEIIDKVNDYVINFNLND